ncbi:MAG: sialidase family protein [Acidimicrobiales bacterium]
MIGPGFYPRAIRLAHAGDQDGTILATYQVGAGGPILRSTDGGATFEQIAQIDAGAELQAGGGVCCVQLWEMPTALGAFPAGTLLWSGSVTVTPPTATEARHNRLAIWRSTDHGLTWQRHGDCAESDGGLWEPFFLVADDGSLVCQYSDDEAEKVAPGAPIPQKLSYTRSTDGGLTWGTPHDIVVDPSPIGRPGMATAAKLPDGTWRMTYERCGALPPCQVRIRSGPDGLHWGDPKDLGTVVATASGSTLWHTPVLSWTPHGGPQGTLLLTGQIFNKADGFAEPTSGAVILANQRGGAGPWAPIDAPVHIPDPFDHYCPNYSSPVVPLDGDRIFELATEWTTDQRCLVRSGTGTIPVLTDVATSTTSITSPPTSTTAPDAGTASTVSPTTTCSTRCATTGGPSRPTIPRSRCTSAQPQTRLRWRSGSSTMRRGPQ